MPFFVLCAEIVPSMYNQNQNNLDVFYKMNEVNH